MSLYGPTFHVTPVDLCIIFQCNLYISCIISCGNKIVSNCFLEYLVKWNVPLITVLPKFFATWLGEVELACVSIGCQPLGHVTSWMRVAVPAPRGVDVCVWERSCRRSRCWPLCVDGSSAGYAYKRKYPNKAISVAHQCKRLETETLNLIT